MHTFTYTCIHITYPIPAGEETTSQEVALCNTALRCRSCQSRGTALEGYQLRPLLGARISLLGSLVVFFFYLFQFELCNNFIEFANTVKGKLLNLIGEPLKHVFRLFLSLSTTFQVRASTLEQENLSTIEFSCFASPFFFLFNLREETVHSKLYRIIESLFLALKSKNSFKYTTKHKTDKERDDEFCIVSWLLVRSW